LQDPSFLPTVSLINAWNALPCQLINAQSVDEFKNKFDIFWAENGYGHTMAYQLTDLNCIFCPL